MLTLRHRLVLVNALVFLLTLVILVGVITSQLLGHLYEQVDLELVRISDRVAARVVIVDGSLYLPGAEYGRPGDAEAKGFVRLLDSQGRVIDGSGDFESVGVTSKALTSVERGVLFNQRGPNGEHLRVYSRPIYMPLSQSGAIKVGYVQAATVPDEALETIAQIRYSLLIGAPLALLIASLAGLFATGKALQPLAVMTESAAAISADSLTERRLPVLRTKDEVQGLALAFNATLDRLAAAFARQRRFTADASHELRTPVTAILGQAELALHRPRAAAAYRESLARIRSEAERMQRLIGRMLALARAESGPQMLTFASTDVAALLHTLTESLAPDDGAGAVRLHVQTPPTATIVTDADSLTQIVLNLLENALAYSERGVVDVSLTTLANAIRIQVSDQGPGIDPEHIAHIFQPFYRADASRQQKRGNVGLGLALAHELTRLLGGQIEAANQPAGGAVFTLTLPQHPPPHGAGDPEGEGAPSPD